MPRLRSAPLGLLRRMSYRKTLVLPVRLQGVTARPAHQLIHQSRFRPVQYLPLFAQCLLNQNRTLISFLLRLRSAFESKWPIALIRM